MPSVFDRPSEDKSVLEEGSGLTPRFDAHGLITAVVTDADGGEVLMLAHMNDEALRLTIDTGVAHFFSRSRQRIWKKGESSGNEQQVAEMRVDCDQDAVWLKVRVAGHGASCHTGRRTCFYRRVEGSVSAARLVTDSERSFDPEKVYGA
ncbi:phosphoribosyl-AMP cyclohydrolase [Pararhizobium haloflavum]|uniref:phosphoribosyl-AMP cyclohydrolase n=1 Tax=Pararhizobium haloflavum TaxID=2037914 RepID=UPI000C189571|nr:phosphoribosyl-AMP cyclohydrolase [Pararhizobium haloflavum]